jgi:hypothetical protein
MDKSTAIVKKQRSGIYSWLRTGRVNPSIRGHKKLQAYLMDLERKLSELQGSGGMTAGREILIKSTVEAFGAVLLASMYCKRAGILRPDAAKKGVIEFQPVLGKQFLAFMNTIRQNLMALGLDPKKTEADFDLADYIKAKDAEKSETRAKKASRPLGEAIEAPRTGDLPISGPMGGDNEGEGPGEDGKI